MKLYEGLFLFDANLAAKDWPGLEKHVGDLLQKNEADLVYSERWPDRKLAYEVKGCRKGTYFLTYFNAPGPAITALHRDVQLSERVLRLMVLQNEYIEEVLDAHKARQAEREAAAKASEAATESAAEKAAEAEPAEDSPAESPEPAESQLAEGDGGEPASGEKAAEAVEEEDAPDAGVESELPVDESDSEVESEPAAEDESQQSEEGESAVADSAEEDAEDS